MSNKPEAAIGDRDKPYVPVFWFLIRAANSSPVAQATLVLTSALRFHPLDCSYPLHSGKRLLFPLFLALSLLIRSYPLHSGACPGFFSSNSARVKLIHSLAAKDK